MEKSPPPGRERESSSENQTRTPGSETPYPPEVIWHPRCDYHPQTPAIARCVGCGRFLCEYCRVMLNGRNYCRTCSAAMGGQGFTWPEAPPIAAKPVREPAFPQAPWSIGEALIIFFAAVAITVTLSIFIYQLLAAFNSILTTRILLVFFSSCILYTLMLVGTFYSVKIRHGSTPSALGLKLEGLGKSLGWGFGLGIPLFAGALFLAYISQQILGPTPTDYVSQSVDRLSTGGINAVLILLLFFTLAVLAPICEEIFFRGYLYPALRNRMNMQPAMLINGLIFAAVHFELVGFLPRLLLGYGLSYIYERNRSLAGPIIGHMLYNVLIIVLAGLFNLF